jgi:hypothetical protein
MSMPKAKVAKNLREPRKLTNEDWSRINAECAEVLALIREGRMLIGQRVVVGALHSEIATLRTQLAELRAKYDDLAGATLYRDSGRTITFASHREDQRRVMELTRRLTSKKGDVR